LLTITLLLIVFFMIEISKIVFALTIRPFPNWGCVLASGMVGVLLSAILWSSLPLTALWLIGLPLGSIDQRRWCDRIPCVAGASDLASLFPPAHFQKSGGARHSHP
jgi:hypothetical protein